MEGWKLSKKSDKNDEKKEVFVLHYV